jgi:Mannose-6-phosphate isomerase
VRSERSLIAAIGVDDLVIVDTPDALLVADKSRSQEVSAIVAKLKQSNRKEHEQHVRNYRPWGYFESLSAPGQAPAREARRQAIYADAPPPLGALGGGARHRARDGRRNGQARAGERKRLHHRHALAPLVKPRQGAARDHRGAARVLPRRGRHHPRRRRLQPRAGGDEVEAGATQRRHQERLSHLAPGG